MLFPILLFQLLWNEQIMWKRYKCVYSIHHWVLVIFPVAPIICITCIFLVKWLLVYSQYVLKPWPTVLLADDSRIWFSDLKCSCLSKVEHNRRCITDIDAPHFRRLPLSRSEASDTIVNVRRFQQRERGSLVITQLMESFECETIDRPTIKLLCFKWFAESIEQKHFFFITGAADWLCQYLLQKILKFINSFSWKGNRQL